MSKRDKFLTEAIGECWHPEFITEEDNGRCPLCDKGLAVPIGTLCVPAHNFINFSTWEGFGKLWEFCQKQWWWENFSVFNHYQDEEGNYLESRTDVPESLVHPDRFADAIYAYLKERDK